MKKLTSNDLSYINGGQCNCSCKIDTEGYPANKDFGTMLDSHECLEKCACFVMGLSDEMGLRLPDWTAICPNQDIGSTFQKVFLN